MSKETLSERQKLILSLVVQEYVGTAKPVGSKRLVDKYKLDLSSANFLDTLCYGLGHMVNMTIHRVIDNQRLHSLFSFFSLILATFHMKRMTFGRDWIQKNPDLLPEDRSER